MNWGTMSRGERDAAYNNTDAVKNSAELNEMRTTRSARLIFPQFFMAVRLGANPGKSEKTRGS